MLLIFTSLFSREFGAPFIALPHTPYVPQNIALVTAKLTHNIMPGDHQKQTASMVQLLGKSEQGQFFSFPENKWMGFWKMLKENINVM